MIDLHSHILPGIDDGAQSWDETLAMARIAVADGVKVMVATPHMMDAGPFANRAAEVLALAAEAQERLKMAGIDLEIVPGGELFLSPETPAGIRSGELLTYANQRRYALVELPGDDVPPYAEQALFECQLAGVTPVLAHPERNSVLVNDLDRLAEWVERGVLLQVNALSLASESEGRRRRAAEELIERRLVHFVASDAHTTRRRRPGLSRAKKRVATLAGEEMAQILVAENPRRLLSGEPVRVFEPVKPKRRGKLFGRLFRRKAREQSAASS